MGNTAMKSETNFKEAEKNLSVDTDIDVEITRSTADIKSSTASILSETLYPAEDAVSSITTDSTASNTEYESANENETSCNRLSSCTDISYDIPLDGHTNEKISLENERQSKVVDENVSQVSRPCISPSELCEAKQREISDSFENELTPFNLHAHTQADVAFNEHFTRKDDLVSKEDATNETPKMVTHSDLAEVDRVLKRAIRNCNVDIESNVPTTVFSNTVIRQQWINIEELARETKQLRKQGHYIANRRPENDRRRLKRTSKLKTKLTNRNTPVKTPIVYNDVFVHTYDAKFTPNSKSGDREKADVSHFDQIGDVLSQALNKVADLLDGFPVHNGAVRDHDAWTKCDERFTLYATEWVTLLNVRARYCDFFEFNYADVLIQQNGDVHKVEEKLVKEFFNNVTYFQMLNAIEFYMMSDAKRLRYVAKIPALDKTFDIEPMVSLSSVSCVPVEEIRNSHPGVELVEIESEDDFELKEDWSDLCSTNNDNLFKFPSLRSEIVECAFQLDSIDSEIMSCNENISEAGPVTAADIDNINNIPFLNDSSELEFISKMGGTGLVAENLRKQSLYVKFDPLVSDEANATLPNGDLTLKFDETLTSNSNNEQLNDISIHSNSEDKNSSTEVTDTRSNESGSVGKLISVTPSKSPRKKKSKLQCDPTEQNELVVTPRSSPRFIETDPDDVSKLQSLLLRQIKKEEAFKEELEAARRDYDQVVQKLQNTEKEMDQLRLVLEKGEENEKKLKNEIKELVKSKQQISVILGDYEKTISQMLNKREEEKKEHETTIKKIETERDSTVQHLNNLENAFNDIHQKYERGKAVNEALKKNEDLLKKSLNEYETTVKTVENKYELLKSHATSQLEKANQELELITQSYEKEQAKLKAMLRKSEIQINSLQNALDRKTKENQELTAICDELIVKLSTHSNA